MLILLPPSDAQNQVRRGAPFDIEALSFPSLLSTRSDVLDALIEVSAGPDAMRRLGVPTTLHEVVERNVALRDAPAAPASSVYSGVLYDGLGLADFDAASHRRARSWIVVISALWGAIRIGDRIPSYRLDMCGRLPGLAHLTGVWRAPLDDVLPGVAGRRVVVDCRSGDFATAWRPTGGIAERTVVLKVVRADHTSRGAGSHDAKRFRGLVVRRIIIDALDPGRPEELAEMLSTSFDLDLRPPSRPGRTWELRVAAP